mmetsp:Transcript_14303/g.19119  ORF Transcript_14303/g.19119 Transcript_14303/m.19119 type:complete len:92 (-) Transcript_14303:61-336(-)
MNCKGGSRVFLARISLFLGAYFFVTKIKVKSCPFYVPTLNDLTAANIKIRFAHYFILYLELFIDIIFLKLQTKQSWIQFHCIQIQKAQMER